MILWKILIIGLFSINIFARNDLGAHVHGSVALDIAIDKKEALIIIKAPAESFLGFEHKARTKREISILNKVKKEWLQKSLNLFSFNNSNQCKVTSGRWEQEFSTQSHSSISAEAYLLCEKNISGTSVNIKLKKFYPRINLIKLNILKESGSVVSKKIQNKEFEIKL